MEPSARSALDSKLSGAVDAPEGQDDMQKGPDGFEK